MALTNITVAKFINKMAGENIVILSPGGSVELSAIQALKLVDSMGEKVHILPKDSNFRIAIDAEELLNQTVYRADYFSGAWRISTR